MIKKWRPMEFDSARIAGEVLMERHIGSPIYWESSVMCALVEAGADAMLKALRNQGYHVDGAAVFTCVARGITLRNRDNTGTYIFIVDDYETDPSGAFIKDYFEPPLSNKPTVWDGARKILRQQPNLDCIDNGTLLTDYHQHPATKVIETGYFCLTCGMQTPYYGLNEITKKFELNERHHCPDPGGRGIAFKEKN